MSAEISIKKPVCVVVGTGPGNGEAFARRFSQAGYSIALLARNAERLNALAAGVPGSKAYPCDVMSPASIEATFSAIARDLGDIDVLIYNAGKGVWGDPLSVSPYNFEAAWRLNVFGAFHAARQALPAMLAAGTGNIIFIGATASRRGGADSTAFAAAKAAQRSLAESLAKAYGPQGIHVSLIVIDAVVGEPLMRAKLTDRAEEFFCMPDDIAATAFMLSEQNQSAWTFELDVRPFIEKW